MTITTEKIEELRKLVADLEQQDFRISAAQISFLDDLAQRAMVPQPQGQALPVDVIDDFANHVIREISEYDDRSSTEDQPEMLLVTAKELEGEIRAAFREYASQLALPAGPGTADAAHVQAARKALAELSEAVEVCAYSLDKGEGFDEAWEGVKKAENNAHKWLLIDAGKVHDRLRAIKRQQASPSPAVAQPASKREIFAICNAYESGYGHGRKKDGLDLSRTPHSDPNCGQAFQIGYEAGVKRAQELEAAALPAADERALPEADAELVDDVVKTICLLRKMGEYAPSHELQTYAKAGRLIGKLWERLRDSGRAALCPPAEEGGKS